jgi:predicted glutamine amidotransferase
MCGLSGFNGERKPNINKIKILSILNETRGKDSCGLSYNGQIYKGYKQTTYQNTSEARDFWRLLTLKSRENYDTTTVLFHNRHGTKGVANYENAHPFGYFEKLEYQTVYDTGEKKVDNILISPDFTLAHNGTLDNLFDNNSPHKKRGFDYKAGDNDSKMLGRILFEQGFDYLAEYEGASALCFFWKKEKNTLYLFHGGTLSAADVMVEERPLSYYYDEEDKGIYFSSLSEHLQVIANGAEILDVPLNTILKFVDGKIVEQIVIDRKIKKKTTQYAGHVNGHQYSEFTDDDYRYPGSAKSKKNTIVKKVIPDSSKSIIWHEGKYYLHNKILSTKIKITSIEFSEGAREILFKDGVIMENDKKISPEHVFYKNGKFIDMYGHELKSWKEGYQSIPYIPFDNNKHLFNIESSSYKIVVPSNSNYYLEKYGVNKSLFNVILETVKKELNNIPKSIFSPMGLFSYLGHLYKIRLEKLLFLNFEILFNESKLKTAIIDYLKEENKKDRHQTVLKLPFSKKSDMKKILDAIATYPNIQSFFKEINVFDYEETCIYNKWKELFGNDVLFTVSLGELLKESPLNKLQEQYYDNGFDIIEFFTKEQTLPFIHGYKSLQEFYDATDYDKICDFNTVMVSEFTSKKDIEDYWIETFTDVYDWTKSASDNIKAFENDYQELFSRGW